MGWLINFSVLLHIANLGVMCFKTGFERRLVILDLVRRTGKFNAGNPFQIAEAHHGWHRCDGSCGQRSRTVQAVMIDDSESAKVALHRSATFKVL
jgi:hypothetical protein